MAKSFNTIQNTTEGFYKEKGSKFLAFAYPVDSLAEVKNALEGLRKKYHDARHYCFAHIIESETHQLVRTSDDGEPGHSAGDPILGQIKSFELTNTLVVVVRYFGGTKLGVSGLIAAYKTAALDVLQKAKIKTVTINAAFELVYPYDKTNEVMRLMHGFDVKIVAQDFQESCQLKGKIDPDNLASFSAKLALLKLKML